METVISDRNINEQPPESMRVVLEAIISGTSGGKNFKENRTSVKIPGFLLKKMKIKIS